jgi:hypothetical protein
MPRALHPGYRDYHAKGSGSNRGVVYVEPGKVEVAAIADAQLVEPSGRKAYYLPKPMAFELQTRNVFDAGKSRSYHQDARDEYLRQRPAHGAPAPHQNFPAKRFFLFPPSISPPQPFPSNARQVRGRTTAPAGLVLGHEITGEVVEIGSDVLHIKKGDVVSVPFNIACGRCRNSQSSSSSPPPPSSPSSSS